MTVELLALYGDDNRLGAFKPKRLLKKAMKFTPQYQAYRGAKAGIKRMRKMHGDERVGSEERDDTELLGAAKKKKFLPGLMKTVKKVGKVTSGITSGVAQAVGVPKSALTALSRLDPTRKKITPKTIAKFITPAPKAIVPVQKKAMEIDTKKVVIIGGAAVGGLVLLKLLMGGPRRA